MRLRFVQRTDCDALAQLVTPCLRQVRGGDIGGLHFVRKLKSKEIGRHATINGYGAVAISHVVVRLAPRVRAPAGAGQCQHGKNAGNNHRKLIAALLGARGLLLLDLLIADGFGHIRVVGVGGQAPIRLLHHRNLTGIGIGSFTGLLADGGRLHHACGRRFGRGLRGLRLVRAGGLNQCCGALGGGIILTQCGRGSHRLVDDVGNRLKITAGGTADQRRLVRQVERIGIQRQRGIRNNGRDIIGAARPQCHLHQTLRAFALIGQRGHRLFDGGIFQHTAQTVRAQQPTVGGVGSANRNIRARVNVKVAKHAHHDVALRVVLGFGRGDTTGVDEVLHVAVVARDAAQASVAQQVGARIADMGDDPVAGHQCHCGNGGAHAGKLAFALGLADDGVMRGHNGGFHHAGDRLDVATGVILLDVGQRPDGDGGCRIAAGVTAHAVAHGDEMLAGEGGILIVRAHGAHIGHRGGIQEQRL